MLSKETDEVELIETQEHHEFVLAVVVVHRVLQTIMRERGKETLRMSSTSTTFCCATIGSL